MTTATAPSAAPATGARSPWFHSATFDLLLILGVPFVTWPLVMLAEGAWSAALLNQLILLTATGHYCATFVRAYGDLDLFRRWKARFLLVPLVLLVTCVALFASGHSAALLLVTMGWAFWHWLAQAFGFARIYDIKVGSFRPWTALLDKLLVVTGFVATVTLNDPSTAMFGKVFLDAGIPLPDAAWFAVIRQVVIGAAVVVGTAYVGNLAATILRGQPWSWQKQFMHATTIGYYWFAFAWLPNVLVAYVLYELFHDVQYYAITWLTCRQRVRRPGTAPWMAWMFRPGWLAALGFLLVMTAFGALDVAGRNRLAPDGPLNQVWLGVFLTVALLHYYYDGFIWKARESALGKDLGIQGGQRTAVVPGLRHAAHWALFFVPLGLVLALGRSDLGPRERAAALVAIAPGDFKSQADLGYESLRQRDLPAALAHYRASVTANPDYVQARANYGNALDVAGDVAGAREQYEQALRRRDDGAAHRQAHVNLGVLLLLAGERAAAQQHFEAGARLGGEDPIFRMVAMAHELPAAAADRKQQLWSTVLQFDPNRFEAHAGLGSLLIARGQVQAAAPHFTKALQQRPDFVPALLGLAVAEAEQGQLERARALVQQVLAHEPGNAQALELRTRLGGR